MITSIEQANAVQSRRVKANKRGYSKAVRTYLRKRCTDGNIFDSQEYQDLRGVLPVSWIFQKSK